MNIYKLITISHNTYGQKSTITITGQDVSAENFLEKCFQHLEHDIIDTGLMVTVEEPKNFSCAGGFFEERKSLLENDIEINDTLKKFPW